jgi:disulfide oxidoreductase YuzD
METPNCIIKKKYNYNSIYYNTNYIEIDNTNNADETNELIKNE